MDSSFRVTARWIMQGIANRIFASSDLKIIKGFPIFTPNSAGSVKDLARLTTLSAVQTFPLIVDLLSLNGIPPKDLTPI